MTSAAPPRPRRAQLDRVLANHAEALLDREGFAGAELWRIEPTDYGWQLVCSWRGGAFVLEVEHADPREWELRGLRAGWPS